MSIAMSERETLGEKIAEIDARLESLRPRLATLREEIAKLIEKENRQVRLFAEADAHQKKTIDKELTEIVDRRGALERECKGVSIAVADLEETRSRIYPDFQRLVEAKQRDQRKAKIEELRKQHEEDQIAEQKADKALLSAREKSNRSYFLWKAAIDQEGLDELRASTDRLKNDWQRHAGPHARAN